MFVISTRNFPPDVGGIQNLIEGLSKSLIDHGPVKVFADTFEGDEIYDKNSLIDIKRISGFKFLKKYRKANLVNDYIINNKVRASFFDHWKSIEHINELSLKKSTSFCLIHSKEINHGMETSINKRMLKALSKPKYIIANSNFTKELAIKNGVKSDNIKIIHPGCNFPINIENSFEVKAQDLFKNSFPKIITVARLDKRKNHQNILMTIKNLKTKFPKIKYISIGNGEEKKVLVALRKELDLENEVIFLHEIEEQMKAALIKKCDLFLMPSIIYKKSIEGFGISFIEAACYSKGSIGGNCGGEKDAIHDGLTGYICDGTELGSIYDSVIKFFNGDNYLKIGKNALKFSHQFSWKKIIKKYLNLI